MFDSNDEIRRLTHVSMRLILAERDAQLGTTSCSQDREFRERIEPARMSTACVRRVRCRSRGGSPVLDELPFSGIAGGGSAPRQNRGDADRRGKPYSHPSGISNVLAGRTVHVVTVNDYLAKFHSEWMGRCTGSSVLTSLGRAPDGCREEKVLLMSIIYGTNTEFGFDYLRDNMAWQKDLVQGVLIMPLSTDSI